LISIDNVKVILHLLSSNQEDAMEAAKAIIADPQRVPVEILVQIARMKTLRTWSRICAVYALGFTNSAEVGIALVEIVLDETNAYSLRSFAAEALGNLRAKNSTPVLQDLYSKTTNADLKKSCAYALSQMRA
jgi:HEAT repeat protein